MKFMRIISVPILFLLTVFFLKIINNNSIWNNIPNQHILIKIPEFIYLIFVGMSFLSLTLFIIYSAQFINVILFISSTVCFILIIALVLIASFFIKSTGEITGFDWESFIQIIFMLLLSASNLWIASLYKRFNPLALNEK